MEYLNNRVKHFILMCWEYKWFNYYITSCWTHPCCYVWWDEFPEDMPDCHFWITYESDSL